ncbi:Txe/YoeB family addiction module toxin [Porphyromonas levii]|uniref:Txe/YoeB family addiction module toxin n=1 Tax=Porphyromonas levii TaxID=28114 RepID=UPI001BAA8A9A|nr:Txe/YoeB family addiction module toxin [Porphyromonas levii]MBR8803576.1 Toxin RelK [Porphyromonas levii]
MYKIISSKVFEEDLKKLKTRDAKVFQKALGFMREVSETPKSGLGKPEPLKGLPEGRWSRRLSQKHRFVYRILEEEREVHLLSAYGHYGDK